MPITLERESRKRLHSWRALLLSVLGVLIVVGTSIPLLMYTDPREERLLRTPGAIVAVTRGDEPLLLGSAWQKWLLRRNPGIADYLGGAIYLPQGGSPNSLVVWVNPKNRPASGPAVGTVVNSLTLIDEEGRETPVSIDSSSSSYVVRSGFERRTMAGLRPVAMVPVSVFPRRGSQFRIRLPNMGDANSEQPDLVIPNPRPDQEGIVAAPNGRAN